MKLAQMHLAPSPRTSPAPFRARRGPVIPATFTNKTLLNALGVPANDDVDYHVIVSKTVPNSRTDGATFSSSTSAIAELFIDPKDAATSETKAALKTILGLTYQRDTQAISHRLLVFGGKGKTIQTYRPKQGCIIDTELNKGLREQMLKQLPLTDIAAPVDVDL